MCEKIAIKVMTKLDQTTIIVDDQLKLEIENSFVPEDLFDGRYLSENFYEDTFNYVVMLHVQCHNKI